MRLKELEIQGFKSFPERVKIKIDKGITGVVGPNGSGKSNISDAIRWVLGETSSRQLRGSGKMEDVIFGGTSKRGAMGYALVRLTLDNSDRTFAIDADEVIIGRRYSRSGESDYTINGKPCRLKDVYELLLDTGLSRDGYSNIGQGRIAEIVGAKSEERREIFEEASGIAKYRYRRTEAERRLKTTEENLERLRDILDELESRVAPLEAESRKAESFLKLAARRKTLEVTLWTDGIHRARDRVREHQRNYETAEAEYQAFERQEKDAQRETEDIREQEQWLTIEIERLNGAIRSLTETISGSESRIAVLKNDIAHNAQSIQSIEEELARGEANQEQIGQEIAKALQAAEASEEAQAVLEQEIDAVCGELERLQAENSLSGERRREVSSRLGTLTIEQTEQKVREATARTALQTAKARLTGVEGEKEEQKARLLAVQKDAAETKNYLSSLAKSEVRLANIRNGLELKLATRKKNLDAADQAEQQLRRENEATEQRLALLQELERSMDGYQSSVKAVMRAAAAGRLRGVVGVVSSILTVEAGGELAIETALGAALQNIVVENEEAAKSCIAFLKQERAGRATFLPLTTVQPSVFRGVLTGSARLASTLVRCEPRYQNIVSSLLGRIVVVEDIHEATQSARELQYRNKIVTRDGQVINAGGSFTGGSIQKSAGLFSRRQEIEELKERSARQQKQRAKAEETTDRLRTQTNAVLADLTATKGEQATLANDRIRAEMEQKRLEALIGQLEMALKQREEEMTSLTLLLTEQEGVADQAAAESARLEEEGKVLTAELVELTKGDNHLLEERNRLADCLNEKKLQQLSLKKDAEHHRDEAESLRIRTREGAERRAELEEQIKALGEKSVQNKKEIASIESAKKKGKRDIAERETEIRGKTEKRLLCQKQEGEAERRFRQLSSQKETVSQEMARLAERRTAAETEYDTTVAKLWEEYQLTVSEAENICISFDSTSTLRAQVAELRGKIRALGSVNVGAIDEYKEVKARYDTLRIQVQDVEKSCQELNRMINELNAQMRQMFSNSFGVIAQNFSRIFQELFGGGEASLTLEDETDVLHSGIAIHVAPPGKVIKNLSALSGGEQALVAISIYFAILAFKPSPFCILDEIEAALDDANVTRYAQYLRRICDKTQFVVITHRRGTMEAADVLYGVTMQEDGISKLLRLDLAHVDVTLVS